MKNYRPVSNLNFLSKIIEKIISNRIRSHLDKNNLSNTNQSAYKPLHSTETALLKIHNDICMNMDGGKTTALVLLDLSAAFDTLDHISIIELLSGWYGISGTVLNWVRSYLLNWLQRVKLMDKLREPFKTDYGVRIFTTEFLLIGTKAQRDKLKKYFVSKLLDQDVTPTDSAEI